jgi:hypothetical protein
LLGKFSAVGDGWQSVLHCESEDPLSLSEATDEKRLNDQSARSLLDHFGERTFNLS